MGYVEIPKRIKCLRCDHSWMPRVSNKTLNGKMEIKCCPKCKSPYWDRKKGEE